MLPASFRVSNAEECRNPEGPGRFYTATEPAKEVLVDANAVRLLLVCSLVLWTGHALAGEPRFSVVRAEPSPNLRAGCWTLVSDEDCGAHQVTEAVLCYDDDGNPGEYCIPFRMTAAETNKCASTGSAGSDRCQLAHEQVCATVIIGECFDGFCAYTTSQGPCCNTAELTGMACNPSDAVAE